jgi:hypothetical protein
MNAKRGKGDGAGSFLVIPAKAGTQEHRGWAFGTVRVPGSRVKPGMTS